MSKRKAGPGLNRSTAFDWINYAVMVILAFIMIYPLWYCAAGSLNEGMDYLRGGAYSCGPGSGPSPITRRFFWTAPS